ncbi:MAG: PQQ-binding-like beta-propeller repeat protein [Acidobacteriota bacterium]
MIASIASVSSVAELRPPVLWVSPGKFRGVPVLSRDRVFARTAAGDIVSVDARSGVAQWRTPLTTSPGVVTGGRLAVADDVVMGGDDGLEGFGWMRGERLWRANIGEGTGAGIQLGGVGGDLVFAGSYVSRLFAIETATGKLRWAADLGFQGEATVFAPRADALGVVATFTSFRDRTGGVVAFDPAGRLMWQTSLGETTRPGVIGPVLLAGDLVLAVDRSGVIHALDRRSGSPSWTVSDARARAPVEDFRPLASGGGMLVAGSLTGELVAYDLATRRERWRAWPVQASIAFGLGLEQHTVWVPYVSGHVVGLDLATGRQRWRFGDAGEGFRWLPLVRGADVFLSGAAGGLVALRTGGGN